MSSEKLSNAEEPYSGFEGGQTTGISYIHSRYPTEELDINPPNVDEENQEEAMRSLSTDLEDVDDFVKLNHEKMANYQTVFDGCGKKIYEAACKHLEITPDHHVMHNLENSNILIPNRSMNYREVGALMEALTNNSKVEELDLSGNFLEDQSCRFIAQMLTQNNFLSRLNIANNSIRDSFGAFYKVLQQGGDGLKQLYASNNRISDAAVNKIAPTLSTNISLVVLDLSNNALMNSQSVINLFKALKTNHSLTSLDLGGNIISAPNLGVSLSALNKTNKTLRFLSLAGCRLHPKAVDRIQKVFIRTSLECLDLSRNHIDPETLIKFAVNVSREGCQLQALFLDHNRITDQVFHAFVRVFSQARNLKVLGLAGYRNTLASVATGDTLIIHESRFLYKKLKNYFDKEGIDPVSLFVRSAEKNIVATSGNAPIEFSEAAVRENLNRLFAKLPEYLIEKYLASLGLLNFMESKCYMDSRCKSSINTLEQKLNREIGLLRTSDISHFMMNLFKFRIYYQSNDVKPLIREERFWLLNKTIHCLVLNKLLDWVDPSFRNLTLKNLMECVEEERGQAGRSNSSSLYSGCMMGPEFLSCDVSKISGANITTSVVRSDVKATPNRGAS